MNKCPYCKIKETAGNKIRYEADSSFENGKCSCGAWLDVGQQKVDVNGYKDIYKGAVKLIDDVIDDFKHLLDYLDIDIEEYAEDIGTDLYIQKSEIIRQLFLPYYGHTTIENFAKSIGIDDVSDSEVFTLLEESEKKDE